MASLYQHKGGAWIVAVYVGRKNGHPVTERKHFADRVEAVAHMESAGLKVGVRTRTRSDVIEHLAANFEVDDNGCWLWTGKLTNADYGRLTWKPQGMRMIPGAHRVVLHALGFPVPEDKVVDHLCRVRHCINPDHLEVVQQRENVLRSPIAPGGINARKTHCPQGHPYSPENTYTYTFKTQSTTTRICRTCSRDHHHRYYLAKRAAKKAAVA